VSNFVTQKRKIESATPDQRMTWLVKDKILMPTAASARNSSRRFLQNTVIATIDPEFGPGHSAINLAAKMPEFKLLIVGLRLFAVNDFSR
jgi:hypothetical protein